MFQHRGSGLRPEFLRCATEACGAPREIALLRQVRRAPDRGAILRPSCGRVTRHLQQLVAHSRETVRVAERSWSKASDTAGPAAQDYTRVFNFAVSLFA
jgi:hypothetical protein